MKTHTIYMRRISVHFSHTRIYLNQTVRLLQYNITRYIFIRFDLVTLS